MSVEKLRQVMLVASDLEAQVEFYTKALGLELAFRDGDRWVQFEAGDVSFALASREEGQGAPPGVPVPVLQVSSLDSALEQLRARGDIAGAIREMGSHGRSALVRDPTGTPLVLFERAKPA